ncbi:MAG: TonB family protein [Desulfohalobiaceae bacterium]|nr:TonB family protein [Desulfohalobiaceae bacterium]
MILVFSLYPPFQGSRSFIDLDKPVYEVELVNFPQKKPTSKAEKIPAKAPEKPKADTGLKKQVQPRIPKAPPPVEIAQKKKKQPAALKKKEDKPRKAPSTQAPPTPEKVLASAMADIEKNAQPEKREEPETPDYLAQALSDIKQDVKQRGPENPGSSGTSTRESLYGGLVEARIKENWRFPGIDDTTPLSAKVELRINSEGKILETTILDSSGRPDFDRSVKKAIAETRILPRPYNQRLQKIVISFHSQEL